MIVKLSRCLLLCLLMALFLTACGQEEPPTPTEQVAVVEEAATDTPEPATATATATNTPEPTETTAPTATTEPTPTEEVVAEVNDECLSCHADKDRLIETAATEEETPNESSGVG